MDYLDKATRAAREVKEQIVAAHGPGSDVIPMLSLHTDDNTVLAFLEHLDREDTLRAIPLAIVAVRPKAVAFVIETYTVTGPFAALMVTSDYRHGDLATAFRAGDPKVKECVTVLYCDESTMTQHTMPYEYKGTEVRWLPQIDDEQLVSTGVYPNTLRMGFAAVARGADPDAALQELAELHVKLETPQFYVNAHVARNDPCPCGSGKKYKHCHGT